MIIIRPYDPDEPEDERPFEEQLLEHMMRPLPEHSYFERHPYPAGTDSNTVKLWLKGYKVEDADVDPELL